MDSDQRLPGERESEGSPLPEDALHWLQVYAELLRNDQVLLTAELDRLRRRHGFWEQRLRQLEGD